MIPACSMVFVAFGGGGNDIIDVLGELIESFFTKKKKSVIIDKILNRFDYLNVYLIV